MLDLCVEVSKEMLFLNYFLAAKTHYYSNDSSETILSKVNQIIYEYDNVDLAAVYYTVRNNIPELLRELEDIEG